MKKALILLTALVLLCGCTAAENAQNGLSEIQQSAISSGTMTEIAAGNVIRTKNVPVDIQKLTDEKINEINSDESIAMIEVRLSTDELSKAEVLSRINTDITKDITVTADNNDVFDAAVFDGIKENLILRISGGIPEINNMTLLSETPVYLEIETDNYDRLTQYTDNLGNIRKIDLTYDPFGKVDLTCLYEYVCFRLPADKSSYCEITANGNKVANTGSPCRSTIYYDYSAIENIDRIPKERISELIDETGLNLAYVLVDDFDNDGKYEGIATFDEGDSNVCGIVTYRSWIVSADKTVETDESGLPYKVFTMDDGTKAVEFYYVSSAMRTVVYELFTLTADGVTDDFIADNIFKGEKSDFVLYNQFWIAPYLEFGKYTYVDYKDGKLIEYEENEITEAEFRSAGGSDILDELEKDYMLVEITARDNGVYSVYLEKSETYDDYLGETKHIGCYIDCFIDGGVMKKAFDTPYDAPLS